MKTECAHCHKDFRLGLRGSRVLQLHKVVGNKMRLWYLVYLCPPCNKEIVAWIGEAKA